MGTIILLKTTHKHFSKALMLKTCIRDIGAGYRVLAGTHVNTFYSCEHNSCELCHTLISTAVNIVALSTALNTGFLQL